MSKIIDLTGQVFTRLTVIKLSENRNNSGKLCWDCVCICGTHITVSSNALRRGNTKSCGCLCKDMFNKVITKHGMQKYPEYQILQTMKQRCSNPNHKSYKDYGGRGIFVCDEWKNSFHSFYSHIGKRPTSKHSIDRIENSNGYVPGNVRWTTKIVQANNQRNNHFLTFNGQTLTYAQWEKITNIKSTVICKRIIRGWGVEKTLTTPVKNNGYSKIN